MKLINNILLACLIALCDIAYGSQNSYPHHLTLEKTDIEIHWQCAELNSPHQKLMIKTKRESNFSLTSTDIDSSISCGQAVFLESDYDENGIPEVSILETLINPSGKQLIYGIDLISLDLVLWGSLPYDIKKIGPKTYHTIFSEGGSLYEQVFFISNEKIDRIKEKELMLDGYVCVDDSLKIISRHSCGNNYKKSTATREKPICIVYEQGKGGIMKDTQCSALLKQWKGPVVGELLNSDISF